MFESDPLSTATEPNLKLVVSEVVDWYRRFGQDRSFLHTIYALGIQTISYNISMKLGTIVYEGKTKKGTPIMIRYPTEADIEKAMDFINTISKEQTFITFQGQQLTLEDEKKYLLPFYKQIENDEAIKLFAFQGGEIVGVSDVVPQERTSNHVGTFGLIIKKEYRGEGIGKLLMQLVLQETKKLNKIMIIHLGVFGENKLAFELYKKMGFKIYGNLPQGVRHKDNYDDHIFMYKLNNLFKN